MIIVRNDTGIPIFIPNLILVTTTKTKPKIPFTEKDTTGNMINIVEIKQTALPITMIFPLSITIKMLTVEHE